LLIDHDLVTAFEVGWSVLHQDVSLFAVEQLIATLSDVDCVDRDIRRGLAALQRTLEKQRDAGTPWRARNAAEVLAMLNRKAWLSVLGLLDECPVLPAALMAVLEGRTGKSFRRSSTLPGRPDRRRSHLHAAFLTCCR
jgi:hypothetical protein